MVNVVSIINPYFVRKNPQKNSIYLIFGENYHRSLHKFARKRIVKPAMTLK